MRPRSTRCARPERSSLRNPTCRSSRAEAYPSAVSACSRVGIRPTRGLVSRAGVMPNSFTQDEIGPITRTVKDAARLLDVMVGYDPKDPITAFGVGRTPASYAAGLNA